jgi:hypothetical protein
MGHFATVNLANSRCFERIKLAPRLLYTTLSGGFSGPASRSGVPLEHPPYQQFACLAAGRVENTLPAPPCTVASSQFSVFGDSHWKPETGNWKL